MPKDVRRRLFYCLIAIFLILGSGVVLYAQGWRVASEPFGLGKVGAVYIRTFPANAQVSMNGKLKNRRIGLFDKGTLLNNILPGEYDLEVNSPGFQPWRLPLVVSSTLVTSLQNVVLVPNQATMVTSTPARDIILAGSTLVIKTATGMRTLAGAPIPGDTVLAGSEDGAIVISYSTSTRNYFAADIPRATSTNLGRFLGQSAGKAIVSFQPVPRDDTLFLAKGPASLNLMRVPNGDVLRLATTGVAAAAAAPGKAVWAVYDKQTNASLLSSYDIVTQNLNPDFEFVPGEVASLLFLESGEVFALTKDASLYSLNFNQSSRVRLTRNVRGVSLSKNGDKLAALGGRGAEIFFLRGNKPDLEIDLPEAARIQRLVWYRDGEHLFVQYPDRIMFLDLKDQNLHNFAVVAETQRPEYDSAGNILYFLDGSALRKLEFPS